MGMFYSPLATKKWTVGAGLSFGWVTAPTLDLSYLYRRMGARKVLRTLDNIDLLTLLHICRW